MSFWQLTVTGTTSKRFHWSPLRLRPSANRLGIPCEFRFLYRGTIQFGFFHRTQEISVFAIERPRLRKWTRSIWFLLEPFVWSKPVGIQLFSYARRSNAHESPMITIPFYILHLLSDLRGIFAHDGTQWYEWKELWEDSETGHGLDERLFILFLQLSLETDEMN